MPTLVEAVICENPVLTNEFSTFAAWHSDPTYGLRNLSSLDEQNTVYLRQGWTDGLEEVCTLTTG